MTAKLNAKLDPKAKIYNELRQQPEWWKRLKRIKTTTRMVETTYFHEGGIC